MLTDEEYQEIREAFDELIGELRRYRKAFLEYRKRFKSSEVEAVRRCLHAAREQYLDQIGYHLSISKRLSY